MILNLAQGMTVEVLEGRLWITQAGRTQDLVLGRGARYSAEGDGVVLVGLEEPVRIDLRAGGKPGWWRRLRQAWEARAAARELEALPDERLRDLGLTRDQIPDAVYSRLSR
jgi:uncharacterized protein YjiS (DUF1127 family)